MHSAGSTTVSALSGHFRARESTRHPGVIPFEAFRLLGTMHGPRCMCVGAWHGLRVGCMRREGPETHHATA